jgi:NADPH:quinone reductase-like Zn-dependent oxidoreductase
LRAVVVTSFGSPEVLEVQERPDPRPGPGEVLVDVRAAGVNFADLMARSGMLQRGKLPSPAPPFVAGGEIAGTVASLGEGIDGAARVGQRVIARVRFGGYAERAVVPAGDLLELPDRLGFEQGAAVPTSYTVAWEAVMRAGNLRAGERVLIHSAGGGVGVAATQIASRAGAEVWGTASPGKHEAIRSFGVDHPLDYTQRGWDRGLPGLDLVLDPLGGRSFRRSFRLLRPGGRLVCFGVSATVTGERRKDSVAFPRAMVQMPWFHPVALMSQSRGVIGLNVLNLWNEFGTRERYAGPLAELLADPVIRPVVARSFPFERAPDAHRFMAERRNIGKVILTPSSASEPVRPVDAVARDL